MFNILLSMAKEGTSDCPQFTTPGRKFFSTSVFYGVTSTVMIWIKVTTKERRFPGSSRDNLINTVYKLHRTRLRILEPYRKLKNALKQLQEDYLKSKDANPIMRYMKLQQSVRDIFGAQLHELCQIQNY
ncbi:hypothetical protein ANCDUO_01411 [Ancylostoma duodenale]|uniref:Uncharacterized protein n=1 Tax=Ancylostoma duodenale TaxID=51022 RepID=A0A0C2H9E3_9BILA|nr:hypothetical protein ANCDUO_01411 [Ancylostoma duodenale]